MPAGAGVARVLLQGRTMRPCLTLALFAVLSLSLAIPSHADGSDQLASMVDTVRQTVQEQGGHCARSLLPALDDLRAKIAAGDLDGAAHRMKRLEHRADAWCGRAVRRGLHHLRAALGQPATGAGGDQPPAVETFTADSTVDVGCVQALKQAYPFQPDRDVLATWLSSCRTGAFAESDCTSTTSEANASCEQAATAAYPYQLDDDTSNAIQSGCRTEHCVMPRAGHTTRTHVDLACFAQRKSSYPYQPDVDHIAGWIDGCRTAAAGTCKTVRVAYDDGCFQAARTAYPYQLQNDIALRLMTECRVIESQCQ